MRAQLQHQATTDADVVLLPIRCAATARLKGFEVLARKPAPCGSACARRDEPKYAPAPAHQLARVLSGEVASLIAGHGLKLWIPLSLDALRRDDSAIVLFDGLAATELARTDITFELQASAIVASVSAMNERALEAIAWQDSRIAVSGLSDFTSIEAALNPRQIWWMVVLIVSLNLAGCIAAKLFGSRSGALIGGVLGG